MDSRQRRDQGLSRAFLERLDLDLSLWHKALAHEDRFPLFKVTIRDFCQSVTHAEGISIGSEPDKLLGPRWEQQWEEQHTLPLGPLEQHNGLLTAQQESLLKDVLRSMVAFLLEGTTPRLLRKLTERLRLAIADYVSTRGVEVQESGVPPDNRSDDGSPALPSANPLRALAPRIHSLATGNIAKWREVLKRWASDPNRRRGEDGVIPIPFVDDSPVTQDEKTVLLAAIHDNYANGLEKINPWPDGIPDDPCDQTGMRRVLEGMPYTVVLRGRLPLLLEHWATEGWKVEQFVEELEREHRHAVGTNAQLMAKAETPADGPLEPNLFWWKGDFVVLEPKAWGVVNHLWHLRTKCAHKDHIGEVVWSGELPGESSVKNAASKAKLQFETKGWPITITSKSNYFTLEVFY